MNFSGKVCVITGASSGIGKSLAVKLSSKGAIVVLAARRDSKLIQIKKKIENNGGTCTGIKTDISKKLDCKNLINETINIYGKIDILILAAGVSMWSPFEKITDVSFRLPLKNQFVPKTSLFAPLPILKKSLSSNKYPLIS